MLIIYNLNLNDLNIGSHFHDDYVLPYMVVTFHTEYNR